jgi:predicted dienelactone hydrolase
MRSFEILLLLVAALTLLSFFFSGRKHVTTVRIFLSLIAAVFVVIHLVVEKYRWQMVPLHGLVAILFVASLIQIGRRWKKSPGVSTSRRRKIIVGGLAVLGLLVLGIEIVILISFPIIRLPEPTGPYAVGTTYLHFVDNQRPETLTDDPNDFRTFTGRMWYPAERPESAKPVEYRDYQPSIDLISAGGPPEFIFSHFHLLTSNSYLDAPISSHESSYPVLVFSIEFLTLYEDYQIVAEEFASQGCIVLILDTPYEWQGVRQPDGSIVSYSQDHAEAYRQHDDRIVPWWERFWDDNTSAEERNAIARQMLESETFMDTALRIRVADIQFAVDELDRLNAGDPATMVAGKLDLSRLGIAGHSMGGAVAGQTCLVDDRFKACANLDGFQWGDVANGEVHQPFMILYSEQFRGGSDFILDNLVNDTYMLTIEGSKHMNFQDMAVVMPGTKMIGMTGSISAQRMFQITNNYLLAFFGKYLNGEDAPLLAGPSPDYPEVEFVFRG